MGALNPKSQGVYRALEARRSTANTTTPGEAIVTKVTAEDGLTYTYTGVDAGTGDVVVKHPAQSNVPHEVTLYNIKVDAYGHVIEGSTDPGAAGTQGNPGTQGLRGAQGNQGASVIGAQGNPGTQGFQGVQGATGSDGLRGYQGNQGRQGIAGIAGGQMAWKDVWSSSTVYSVNDGVQYNGSSYICILASSAGTLPTNTTYWSLFALRGTQGAQGTQGNQGASVTGFQGAQGTQGSAGGLGVQGSQGIQGTSVTGTQGNQGVQGTSVIGTQGTQGIAGSIGNQGQAGAQGIQGVQGSSITGTQGTQGIQGNQGASVTGAQGVQGAAIVGSQGNQGVTVTGAQGVQGVQGHFGSQGIQGSSIVGAQGTQGLAGGNGTQGVQGNQGSQGNQGASAIGTQGFQGNQGSQGTQGLALADIQASATVYVNPTYTGTTVTGTAQYPYKTIDAAITSVTGPTRIELAPATYVSNGGTWPAYPISIIGCGSTVVNSSTITVASSYFALNLSIQGNVTYSGNSTDRYYLVGGSTTGNVIVTTGLLHDEGRSLLGGAVTINGGTFEAISTTITSTILHTAGQLLLQNDNVNATKSTALITSTATTNTDLIALVNCFITNLGTGTALDTSANTSTSNYLANSNFVTASAASVIGGTTCTVQVVNCNYTVAPTGTVFIGTNWGYIGASILTGNQLPSATNTIQLGSAARQFANIYAATVASGSGNLTLNSGGGIGYLSASGTILYSWNNVTFAPYANGTRNLGSSTFQWAAAYSKIYVQNSAFGVQGVTDGTTGSIGYLGEVVESLIAPASAVTLTSGTPVTVTSIALTAGDWEIVGCVNFVITSATVSSAEGSISGTSATHSSNGNEGFAGPVQTSASTTITAYITARRMVASGNTTDYLVASATFSGTSCKAYGVIHARRMR